MNLPDRLDMDTIKPLKPLSPAVLIAVFTIDANPIRREDCLACCANWFVEKPTETDALLEVVRHFPGLKPFFHFSQGALNA